MIVGIIIISVVAIAIGILAWQLHKREKTSQEEVINKPVSQPSNPPVDEVPKEEEKEPEKPKEEVVEHKFNVDNWITDVSGRVWHIDDIEDNWYLVSLYEKGDVTILPFTIDNRYSLWTLQDAKDGDVLADKYNNIGIFQEREGICWHSYIYLGCDGKLRGFSIGGRHEQTDTHPATKEQRDTLMKAMADAGYIFDFEKKELKKIEPKPWSEEDEEALGDALWCCKQAASLAKDENDMGNIWYAEKWLESIKGRVQPPTNV